MLPSQLPEDQQISVARGQIVVSFTREYGQLRCTIGPKSPEYHEIPDTLSPRVQQELSWQNIAKEDAYQQALINADFETEPEYDGFYQAIRSSAQL